LLLLSYVLLTCRSALLVYHGYHHDLLEAQSGLEPPSGTGGGVIVGNGRRWTSLSGVFHELFVMMNASFEEGFGVWGGKHSEIGETRGAYMSTPCLTLS
jgi:hypothetical protein